MPGRFALMEIEGWQERGTENEKARVAQGFAGFEFGRH